MTKANAEVSGAGTASAGLPGYPALEGTMELPQEPPPGLLMSMALRYDHGLACPGYYDTMPSYPGDTHAKRLEHVLRVMRQLYEEVSGHGFYRPEREAEYTAMLTANAGVTGLAPEGDKS